MLGKFLNHPRFQITLMVVGLLACPTALCAQHGGGGGHIGGPSAGGGGLSGGGKATGIDTKDDLRDFHEIMAVQASSEQRIAFAAMIKSAEIADAALQALKQELGKGNNAALAAHDKTLDDALETARTLNKRFIEGFSEAQKSGLKEMIKRLAKADSELAQQSRMLDQAFESKLAGPQMASAADGLGQTLTTFQQEQLGLGEEMSIDASSNRENVAYSLPPVKNIVKFANQPVAIGSSGVVSKVSSGAGENKFAVELTADLTDLQHSIADVLRVQLDKADRCGEQIAVQTAALTPQPPSSLLLAQLHYERWTCNLQFGRENINEIVEGNGTIEVKLTPSVGNDGTLQLNGQISRIDSQGLLGQLLRSGSLGETLRDKISQSVLIAISQGSSFNNSLPPGVRNYATLRRAQFQGTGAGRLTAVLDGDIRVSNDDLAAVTAALKQSTPTASLPMQPQLTPR